MLGNFLCMITLNIEVNYLLSLMGMERALPIYKPPNTFLATILHLCDTHIFHIWNTFSLVQSTINI